MHFILGCVLLRFLRCQTTGLLALSNAVVDGVCSEVCSGY